MIDAETLKALVEREVEGLADARVATHIRSLLVEPRAVLRSWDYGEPGDQYPCWVILDDGSDSGIAYCESGFGPRNPWGLVWLGDDEHKDLSIGMDSDWFPTFLDAYFASGAATKLPIWRVFRTDRSGAQEPITEEGSWEATWERVAEYRNTDLASRYDCRHSLTYKR